MISAYEVPPFVGMFLILLLSGCQEEPIIQERSSSTVNYSEHVAPILNKHCVVCHRAGESGPFSFSTYASARKHASDIATVARDRYMPPWLPAKGEIHFAGERILAPQEIEMAVGRFP